MRKTHTILLLLAAIAALALLCGCAKDAMPSTNSAPQSISQSQSEVSPASPQQESQASANASKPAAGELIVTFDYKKQSGYASNQFAVWIEDSDGNFVRTLYATRYTAKGGYKNRPDSIPTWVAKSELAGMPKAEVDAITGATPKTSTLSYIWDLTDSDGKMISPGEYRFFIEGSLRWKNHVLYSGIVNIGDVSVSAQVDAQFFFETSGDQPALSDDSSETAMISAVTANFSPAAGN